MSSLPPTWSGMTQPQKAVWWHSAVGASTNFSMSINAVTSNYFTTAEPEPDPLEQAVRYARGQRIVDLLRAGRLRITRKSAIATFMPWSPKFVVLPPKLFKYVVTYHEMSKHDESGLGYISTNYNRSYHSLHDIPTGTSFIEKHNYKGYRPILEDE